MQDLASKTAQITQKQQKKTCISASLLELIPGFEPGTSSLPMHWFKPQQCIYTMHVHGNPSSEDVQLHEMPMVRIDEYVG